MGGVKWDRGIPSKTRAKADDMNNLVVKYETINRAWGPVCPCQADTAWVSPTLWNKKSHIRKLYSANPGAPFQYPSHSTCISKSFMRVWTKRGESSLWCGKSMGNGTTRSWNFHWNSFQCALKETTRENEKLLVTFSQTSGKILLLWPFPEIALIFMCGDILCTVHSSQHSEGPPQPQRQRWGSAWLLWAPQQALPKVYHMPGK